MPELNDDLFGGRKTLAQLISERLLPYEDLRPAKQFLDRIGAPFVIVRRQRCYRPAAVREALDRHEQHQIEVRTEAAA